MNKRKYQFLAFTLLVFVMSELSSQATTTSDWLEPYNVVWNSPSKNSSGSMPLGNGDIAVNVWTENDNELVLLLAKSDAWDENSNNIKLGRIRIKFLSAPSWSSGPFIQKLDLRRGEIRVISGTSGDVSEHCIWVDANNPVIRIESKSDKPVIQEVVLEMWRDKERKTDLEVSDFMRGINKVMLVFPDEVATHSRDAITWWHCNRKLAEDGYEMNMKLQGMEEFMKTVPHPLVGRVFGASVCGDGLQTVDAKTLRSKEPAKTHSVSIYPLAMQQSNAAEWNANLSGQIEHLSKQKISDLYTHHLAWWNEFWERSWIRVSEQSPLPVSQGDAGSSKSGQGTLPTKQPDQNLANACEIARAYQLCRFMNACAGRGGQPIKFNGSLFTVGKSDDPDYRRWGGPGFWYQNERLVYWPMLAEGDFDLMEPWFRMYREMLPFATARCKKWFNHEGALFGETVHFWGAEVTFHYKYNDKVIPFEKRAMPNCNCSYLTYYWQNGLETTEMMLDYYQFTGDKVFLKQTLIPHAEAVSKFYDLHYSRTSDGKIRFDPAQSLETWHKAVNPLPEIAGIRAVMPRLLKLSGTTQEQLHLWKRLLDQVPVIPMGTKDGKNVLLPAESFSVKKNSENPELYAIFPYRLYGVGSADLKLAQDTFEARSVKVVGCWHQDDLQSALLGLTDQAKNMLRTRASQRHYSSSRFPAFWNQGSDWIPDVDHGGNLQLALQYMLLQSDANTGKIHLLPAFPKDWNVEFKLHTLEQTMIECEVKSGKIVKLNVAPESRRKDVVICPPFVQ